MLRDVLKDHLPILRQERLVTDRPPYLMRAADRTFVEVFEWKSAAAIEAAHHSSALQARWGRFEEPCTYEPPLNRKESTHRYPNYEAIDPRSDPVCWRNSRCST